jgi:hypothetical protein
VLPVQRLACNFFLLDRTLLDIFQDFLHSSPLAALLFSPHVADSQNFWRSCHNLEVKLGVQVCSNTSNQTLRLAILDNTDFLPCYRLSLLRTTIFGAPFIRSRYFELRNRLYVGCGNLELYLYALYMISDTCGPYFVLPPIRFRVPRKLLIDGMIWNRYPLEDGNILPKNVGSSSYFEGKKDGTVRRPSPPSFDGPSGHQPVP